MVRRPFCRPRCRHPPRPHHLIRAGLHRHCPSDKLQVLSSVAASSDPELRQEGCKALADMLGASFRRDELSSPGRSPGRDYSPGGSRPPAAAALADADEGDRPRFGSPRFGSRPLSPGSPPLSPGSDLRRRERADALLAQGALPVFFSAAYSPEQRTQFQASRGLLFFSMTSATHAKIIARKGGARPLSTLVHGRDGVLANAIDALCSPPHGPHRHTPWTHRRHMDPAVTR